MHHQPRVAAQPAPHGRERLWTSREAVVLYTIITLLLTAFGPVPWFVAEYRDWKDQKNPRIAVLYESNLSLTNAVPARFLITNGSKFPFTNLFVHYDIRYALFEVASVTGIWNRVYSEPIKRVLPGSSESFVARGNAARFEAGNELERWMPITVEFGYRGKRHTNTFSFQMIRDARNEMRWAPYKN